jgi:hypothetical protein
MLLNKTKKLYSVLFFSAFSFTIYSAENTAVRVLTPHAQRATENLFDFMLALSPDGVKLADLQSADREHPVKVAIGKSRISFEVGGFDPSKYPESIQTNPDFQLLVAAMRRKDKDEKLAEVMRAIESGANPCLKLSMKFLKTDNPVSYKKYFCTPVYSYLEQSQNPELFEKVLRSNQPMPLDFTLRRNDPVFHLWMLPRTLGMLKVLADVSQSKNFQLSPELREHILDGVTRSKSYPADVFEAYLKLPNWLDQENKKSLFEFFVGLIRSSATDHPDRYIEEVEFWGERLQRLLKHVDCSDLSGDSLKKAKGCLTRVEDWLTQQGL